MTRILLFLLALLAFASPVEAQRRGADFKDAIAECKGLIPITRANTAATGAWCSLLGYNSAVAIVQSGLMDATAQYIILQDSTVGSAGAALESLDLGPYSPLSVIFS